MSDRMPNQVAAQNQSETSALCTQANDNNPSQNTFWEDGALTSFFRLVFLRSKGLLEFMWCFFFFWLCQPMEKNEDVGKYVDLLDIEKL